MKELMVYYNPDPYYDGSENQNANIWIAIDGMHIDGFSTVHRVLFKGELDCHLKNQRPNRHAPVGIFGEGGITCIMNDGTMYVNNNIAKIDYKTITPVELEQILQRRISELQQCLVDPDTKIRCFRGPPPIKFHFGCGAKL